MSLCNKNCSCSCCTPYRVPVSKALKAIDVCQLSPKECDCSGSVNIKIPDFEFIANICPHCNLQGSSISSNSFNSTVVNSPQCVPSDTGTILNVTGFGTLIFSQPVQRTFMLQLFKKTVGDNLLNFTASGFDQNGGFYTLSISATAPNEFFMINSCNSCHSSFLGMTNITSKSHKLQAELYKGEIVIMKNGQIEVKEF